MTTEAIAVPIIRRARGYRLYDQQGMRYLDLYRDGGGSLLGHRSGVAVALMKSVLSQGLSGALPTLWEQRLIKAVASLVPGHPVVRLFSSRARALEAVSRFLGMRVDPSGLHDPAVHHGPPPAHTRAALWRPFLSALDTERARETPVLPVLPLTVCEAPAVVCFPDDHTGVVPVSDRIPGFILAGAVSALARLRSIDTRERFVVSKTVQTAIDHCASWTRIGPYVSAAFDAVQYPSVFAEFLRAGVLLSTSYPGPSILPGECSPGEGRLLADLFRRFPGG